MAFRTCPLCEAGCGLELTLDEDRRRVTRIRGDRDDVFSGGFLCPKGTTLGHLHEDPDWQRFPLIKRDGVLEQVGWDEAFEFINERLMPLVAEHGRNSVAVYLGNPGAHSLGLMLHNRSLLRAVGTTNRFSASTVDQRPKEISAALMFGSVTVPVPDLDRTDHLLMLGANPYASNGSLCTAPDFPGRLERLQERGGKVVVVDPRRSETAAKADQHVAIRPGTDAHLLAAVAMTLLEEGLSNPENVAEHCSGLESLPELLSPFTPEAVESVCGVPAAIIRDMARELAAAPTAAVYGRIGTTTQEFGTLTSWLVDVVNILTGNFDRVGGAMFAKGAAGQPSTSGAPGRGRGFKLGRAASRVSGSPESFGEFSVSVLPEEIETEGEGQVRALITVAGNPVSSNPNSDRLDEALQSLDFMVSIDPYINETTRHADVILPPPSPLQKGHYDLALLNFAVRNVANYSPPVLPLEPGQMSEEDILMRLAALMSGAGPNADLAELDESIMRIMIDSAIRDEHSKVAGRDGDELLESLGPRRGVERMLDFLLRTGPYGDGFEPDSEGLSLAKLEQNPHGVDLGPLQGGRLPDNLRTPDGLIDVAPPVLARDLDRLAASVDRDWEESLVLVGRRHVRSNNSWMHNIRVLTKGKHRCTMQIHPADAARIGVEDGGPATVTSRVGTITIDAEITDGIRRGVVSVPHGFGQNREGVQLRVASDYRGVNTNVLTDETFSDAVSGNIALNGVPVTVAAG